MTGISEDDYLDMLDLIHEAALAPAAWEQVLRRLARLTNCVAGGLTLENPSTGTGEPLVYFGFDPAHVERTFTRYLPMNPLFAIAPRMRPGFVVTNGMVVPTAEFQRSEFYNGWARPQGICSPLTVVLYRRGPVYAPLTLVRPDGTGESTAEDCALLTRLAPHLVRALQTGMRLERLQEREHALDAALSKLSVAVLLLNEHRHITYANAAAERLLASPNETALQTRNRALFARDPPSDRALQRALAIALAPDAPEAAEASIAREGRRALALTALPLPAGREKALLPEGDGDPACLVLVRDPEAVSLPAAAATAARAYGLTPAEARLLAAVLGGEGLGRAAERLRVSRRTAQAQLQSVFAKTGTRRQGELIGLVLASLPLAP